MSLRRHPVAFKAASTVAASGASIAAVAPLAGSWSRTPKLSLRQRNRWVFAGIGRFPVVAEWVIRLRPRRRNIGLFRSRLSGASSAPDCDHRAPSQGQAFFKKMLYPAAMSYDVV